MNNDFRNSAPIPENEIVFNLPTINSYKIKNDIDIYFVEKNNLPICQIEVIINSGSKLDPLGKEGLCHLTAMMMDEGAGKYSSLQLSEEFEKIGSVFSILTDKDTIHVSILTLTEHLERSIELLSLVLWSPNFNNEDFERELKKLIAKNIQIKDNPASLANRIFDKVIFEDTPYANPVTGIQESLSYMSVDFVKEFYASVVSPENITITCTGSSKAESIINLFNKFTPETGRNNKGSLTITKPNVSRKKLYLVNAGSTAQTEIRVGHAGLKRNLSDYFPTYLMNSILGGQFTSRINLNLREDKGYTYGASSTLNYYMNLSSFIVSTSVQTEVTEKALTEILSELKKIKNGVTQEELKFAKSSIIKRFPSQFETYSQVTNNISTLIIYELPKDYFNNYISWVNNVSTDEVNKSAIDKISLNDLSIVCVGDAEIIKNQINSLVEFEIVELDKDGKVI